MSYQLVARLHVAVVSRNNAVMWGRWSLG